eukprot:UN00166
MSSLLRTRWRINYNLYHPYKLQQMGYKSKFHILPGGPQNANSPRLVRRNLKAFLARIKRVGFIRTMRELNMTHEIMYGETLGTLRGIDEFGNEYYENLDNAFGRHRWVNFAEIRRENSHGPTIPPGWFGWMHHARNTTPADPGFPKPPKWVLLHAENFTGTDKAYLPTNYGQNTSQAWKGLRYQSWDPDSVDRDENSQQQPRIDT